MKDVKISARRDLKNKIIQEQGVKYDDDNLRDKTLIHGETTNCKPLVVGKLIFWNVIGMVIRQDWHQKSRTKVKHFKNKIWHFTIKG